MEASDSLEIVTPSGLAMPTGQAGSDVPLFYPLSSLFLDERRYGYF